MDGTDLELQSIIEQAFDNITVDDDGSTLSLQVRTLSHQLAINAIG
jgi:N-acetylglutamate synthase/N-acetylornithine aminotransferase